MKGQSKRGDWGGIHRDDCYLAAYAFQEADEGAGGYPIGNTVKKPVLPNSWHSRCGWGRIRSGPPRPYSCRSAIFTVGVAGSRFPASGLRGPGRRTVDGIRTSRRSRVKRQCWAVDRLKPYVEGNGVMVVGGLNEYLTSDSPLKPGSMSIFVLTGPSVQVSILHLSFPYPSFPLEPRSSVRRLDYKDVWNGVPVDGGGRGYTEWGQSNGVLQVRACNWWGIRGEDVVAESQTAINGLEVSSSRGAQQAW